MSTVVKKRKFFCGVDSHTYEAGDTITSETGGHWQIVERFSEFAFFVLKSCLSGEKIVVRVREYPEKTMLLEMRNPEGLYREYNNAYKRKKPQQRQRKLPRIAA